jgi:hypothetical protein
MNARERSELADIVAAWEWSSRAGDNASAAATRGQCAHELAAYLPESDLMIARSLRISEMMGVVGDDRIGDALDDLIDAEGYSSVIDYIEEHGFDGLRARLSNSEPRE